MKAGQVESSATVVLTGALTVGTLPEVRLQVLAALQEGRRVTLDCAAATGFDVAFVQLLEAARGLAQRLGGALELASPVPGGLAAILTEGGFTNWSTPAARSAA